MMDTMGLMGRDHGCLDITKKKEGGLRCLLIDDIGGFGSIPPLRGKAQGPSDIAGSATDREFQPDGKRPVLEGRCRHRSDPASVHIEGDRR